MPTYAHGLWITTRFTVTSELCFFSVGIQCLTELQGFFSAIVSQESRGMYACACLHHVYIYKHMYVRIHLLRSCSWKQLKYKKVLESKILTKHFAK